MTDYRKHRTSDLIRMLAGGAHSPDDHEAVAEEIDRRIPPPELIPVVAFDVTANFETQRQMTNTMWELRDRGGISVESVSKPWNFRMLVDPENADDVEMYLRDHPDTIVSWERTAIEVDGDMQVD